MRVKGIFFQETIEQTIFHIEDVPIRLWLCWNTCMITYIINAHHVTDINWSDVQK